MMRTVFICLVALLALTACGPSAADQSTDSDELDQAIMRLVTKAKTVLQPLIDPLELSNDIVLDKLSSDRLTIKDSSIRAVKVDKLSTFNLTTFHADVMDLRFRVKIGFDKVNAFGNYTVDAHADIIDVTGDGDFKIQLNDLTIDLTVGVTYEESKFQLKEIDVDLDLHKLTAILSGLFGDPAVSELISGIVSDVGPVFLKEFKPEIKSVISGQGKILVNKLLANVNINDLIDLIAGAALSGLDSNS